MKKSLILLAVLAAAGLTACDKPQGPWQSDTTKPVTPDNPNLYKNPQGIPGPDDGRPTHEVKDGGVNTGGGGASYACEKDGIISLQKTPCEAKK